MVTSDTTNPLCSVKIFDLSGGFWTPWIEFGWVKKDP